MKTKLARTTTNLIKLWFKTLYPLARSLNLKIRVLCIDLQIVGKHIMQCKKLKKANSGLYLAPLRLLALEGYEDLKESK